jgi:hypothetical protein
MKHKKVLLAALLAASGFAAQSAYAVTTDWVGTADYTAAANSANDEDVVGPFSTYDAGAGVVLLEVGSVAGPVTNYNGYYQSYVTKHELLGNPVLAPNLDITYELTLVANFTESVNTNTNAITVNSGGTFNVYLDTNNSINRSFTGDSGFTDGDLILTGTVTGGAGTAIAFGGMVFGATDISIAVTGYDTNVFNPDTITDAGGIFTLRLNNPYDASFLGGITSVQGNNVGPGDLKFAADGYLALAVPEAETYAMMLAGLGLVGFMARRRSMSII